MLATLMTALFFMVKALRQLVGWLARALMLPLVLLFLPASSVDGLTVASIKLGHGLFHEEPLPYLVHQPLPWQVQYVTQSRRTSRDSEKGGSSRHNSIYSIPGRRGDGRAVPSGEREELSDPVERAAVTIQTHFRRYQQHRQGL